MARSFHLPLSLSKTRFHASTSSRLVYLRTESSDCRLSHADLGSTASSSDQLLRKLEDSIQEIIVRRSAPDWLPFVPGASYWVPPPRSQTQGIALLVEKLANSPKTDDSLATRTVRGWPSSDYFIEGLQPHPPEAEMMTQSEDEEG